MTEEATTSNDSTLSADVSLRLADKQRRDSTLEEEDEWPFAEVDGLNTTAACGTTI